MLIFSFFLSSIVSYFTFYFLLFLSQKVCLLCAPPPSGENGGARAHLPPPIYGLDLGNFPQIHFLRYLGNQVHLQV